MNIGAAIPLSDLFDSSEGSPIAELLGDQQDRVAVSIDNIDAEFGELRGKIVTDGEIELKLPGVDAVSLVFHTKVIPFEIQFPELTLGSDDGSGIVAGLRFNFEFLRPVEQKDPNDPYSEWVEKADEDGVAVKAELSFEGLNSVTFGLDGSVDVDWGQPEFSLSPVMFGKTGIVLRVEKLGVYLSEAATLPDGLPENFRGVTIKKAQVYLPKIFGKAQPLEVTLTDASIGSNGFSGKLRAGSQTGLTLFGIEGVTLESLSLEFEQNVPVEIELKCKVKLPFLDLDEPLNLDLSVDEDGNWMVALAAASTAGVVKKIRVSNTEIAEVTLYSLSVEHIGGVYKLKVTGTLLPLWADIKWPTFEIRELSIDSSGKVKFDGGFAALSTAHALDFHGAKIEITQFNMGQTDDGGKFIAMSGSVELVKNIPAGASVEGLRIVWYNDKGLPKRPPKLSFKGIGVEFTIPNAIEFKGHVSYEESAGNHRFVGDLDVRLPSVDLKMIGKAVFGTKMVDGAKIKYFAIYLEGDFGTGIPLFATGLSLYGFAGLLAINYAPNKPPEMSWYAIDKSKSWFHKPQTGITDISGDKWKPQSKAWALGAGITLGTTSDNGHSFNGKFLLLLLCPGPVIMFEGSLRFLGNRDDPSEPPFHGLIVLDSRAGSFLIGLDAKWKADKKNGRLVEISGSAEAYFSFHDPTAWHLWIGKRTPTAQRIQASFVSAFTANAYFMLDAKRLELGAWIGKQDHYRWGPIRADLEAWLDTNAIVNFKPAHFHAGLSFHGYLGVRVFGFRLGFGLDARLAADVFKPFHIVGELAIKIETRLKKFEVKIRLEWGPRIERPELTLPELLPIQNCGLSHPKSSLEWPFDLSVEFPLVPMDVRPYVTFGYPIYDEIGVGVNSGTNPGWQYIGDPVTQKGAARVLYSLKKIELYDVTNSNNVTPSPSKLLAARPKPPDSPEVGEIFGSWAPSPVGSAGRQNKLLLWSKNPLDFGDKSESWNPWLSSNLPNYPCPLPVRVEPKPICVDFRHFEVDKQLYGAWRDPEKPDFRIDWTDGQPKSIALLPSASFPELGMGLSFPAPLPRKRYRAYVANGGDNTVVLLDIETRKIVATVPAGAYPRAVVLSPDGKRAYTCNQNGNTFITIDTATNTVFGTPLPIVKSPVSIAISADGRRAFVPSGSEPSMSVVDLQSLTVAATMRLGAVSNRVVLSSDGKKGYVLHGPAGKLTVFSPRTLAVTKVLEAPGGPDGMVFHPSQHRAWVSFPGVGKVREFDASRDQFTARETATGKWPRDLALSPDGARLYVGNLQDNTLSVLDTLSLGITANIPLPSPAGLKFTPDGGYLLVSNFFTNTVTIVDPLKNRIVADRIAAGKGSMAFAVIEAPPEVESIAFVGNAMANSVSVVDLQTRAITATIPVGSQPGQVALTPDGKRLCVCCEVEGTFQVIDVRTNKIVGVPIKLGVRPYSFAVSADGKRAFVANAQERRFSVIELDSLKVVATLNIPEANHVVLSRNGKKCYVVHVGAVSVIATDSLTVTKVIPSRVNLSRIALHPKSPMAFVSCANEGSVRGFDLEKEIFIEGAVKTGAGARDICFAPNGTVLYVANLRGNTVSVVDVARRQVTSTIPMASPVGAVFTSDYLRLIVANLEGRTISLIDPSTNLLAGPPIPTAAGPTSIAHLVRTKVSPPLVGTPVEVTIDVPRGSASVEIAWSGKAPLRGTVSMPQGSSKVIVANPGAVLNFDASSLGLAPPGKAIGIDQVRLVGDSSWILIRVCVTKPPIEGGLTELTRVLDAMNQQVDVWRKPTVVLPPDRDYQLVVKVEAKVDGLGKLGGWAATIPDTKTISFRTVRPPALLIAPITLPGKNADQATGLNDLSLYVRRTVPSSIPGKGELPSLTKPVFRAYDVTVEFNENYVDQLYSLAGRDLELILFDCNNLPVRDGAGSLTIADDAWDNAPKLVLTKTQARWVEMLNVAAGPCSGLALDPVTIKTNKTLGSRVPQVLESDSVYEARLVPRLARFLPLPPSTGWIADGSTFETWVAPGGESWTDYRVSVLARLQTAERLTVFFRQQGGDRYEFTIDPSLNHRTLSVVKNSATEVLADNYYTFKPGTDEPYRLCIEVIGSNILISQNGEVVFRLDVALLANPTTKTLPKGTAGLSRPTGQQKLFTDFGVSDLGVGAPVAYRFHFTTSEFTNFYHQIHSHQGELWRASLTGGPSMSDLLAKVGTDEEWRAYEEFSSLVLGPVSAQDPQRIEVTRVERSGDLLGWILRSPEPIDRKRTDLSVAISRVALRGGSAPGSLKITETQFEFSEESVTLLAREVCNLSGCALQYQKMPAELDDNRGQVLWSSRTGAGQIPVNDTFGDSNWQDYRIKAVVRASRPGVIGLRFRQVDEKNFYSFVLVPETGSQKFVKTVDGVPVLSQDSDPFGDPSLGLTQTISVSLIGTTITVYRDDKEILKVTDDKFAGGGVGTIAAAGSEAAILSLEVREQPNEAYALYHGSFAASLFNGWQDTTDGSGLRVKSIVSGAWTDCVIRARIISFSRSVIGVVFRFTDALNHYRFVFAETERRLERVLGGVCSVLWRADGVPDIGRLFEFGLALKGARICIFHNGVVAAELTDLQLQNGGVGVCAKEDATVVYSQFLVYPSDRRFAQWTTENDFVTWVPELWTIFDEGQNGPSGWTVNNGRLVQTSAIGDTDPAVQRGTMAVLKGSKQDSFRLVTSLRMPAEGAVGLLFGFQDKLNFYRLSFDSGTSVRRLVRTMGGSMQEIWKGGFAMNTSRDPVLTVDSTDGRLRAWVDGDELFDLLGEANGEVGFYCSGTPNGSFGRLRIGVPAWVDYYSFGHESSSQEGQRIRVTSAPDSGRPIRSATEPGQTALRRFSPEGAHLRIVNAVGIELHSRAFLPSEEFQPLEVRCLWKADGTGILIIPTTTVPLQAGLRVQMKYRRDITENDPDSIVLTQAGSSNLELAYLDIPSEALD